jgi:hypothetical protein
MTMTMNRFVNVLPLMMAVLMLLAALGSARRIEDKKWTGGELPAAASGDHPIIQFAKHVYLQRLQAGAHPSCGTYYVGNPQCPPPPPPPPHHH